MQVLSDETVDPHADSCQSCKIRVQREGFEMDLSS